MEIIENSLNDYLESETESVLLNTKKIIVKHNEDSSPTIHLFKCIKEYKKEQETHNDALKEKAKIHFREYDKYFQQKGFTYAFYPLCKAYLYANSVIDIFSLTDSISTALDMFLNEINIEAEPSKIDNVMPGVKTYKETIINSYFSNKNNVLKLFKLKARFKKGSNDWDKNEQSVDLGSSGSKRLNIGTIKSKTASQEIVLYPDLTRLFENKIIKSDIEKDVMRSLKNEIENKFMEGEPHIRIKIDETFKVQIFKEFDKCSIDDKNKLKKEIDEAFDSSDNFTLDQKPKYLLFIDIVKVNNNSYRISASLNLKNGEEIAKYPDKSLSGFNKQILDDLYENTFSSTISVGKIDRNNKVELLQNNKTITVLNNANTTETIENGNVNFVFKYNNLVFKDTSCYINENLDLTDWFIENNNIVGYKVKEIKYTYDIYKPSKWNGLMIFWDDKKDVYSSIDNSFKTLNYLKGKSDKKHKLKFKKDGWYTYKNTIEPNLLNPNNSIPVNMKKVDFNTFNSFKFYTVPGSAQYQLYQTKSWRKWQAGAYLLLVTYFIREGYRSYQTYTTSMKDYDHYKHDYESLENQDDNELYNYYYDNALSAHSDMTSAYNEYQLNMTGLTLIYSINMAEVIQGWRIFGKK